jgi:hypothetical protein
MSAGVTELSRAFAGEDVLGGWDSRVQAIKHRDDDNDKPLPGTTGEGAADDEWD